MGKASRVKGKEGEEAVARLFREAGWDVRGVQRGAADAGDLLATPKGGRRAATEPLGVDISDYSDEWCAGFLAGQANALDELSPPPLVLDSKRQERIRLLEWSRQVEGIARDGEVPAVVWRPSREPWRVSLRLDDLLGMLAS